MGKIAEMILDGTVCEWCECFIGEAVGYPRECFRCTASADELTEDLEDSPSDSKDDLP